MFVIEYKKYKNIYYSEYMRKIKEIKEIFDSSCSFFQVFLISVLIYVMFSPFLMRDYCIDGETIYIAGFYIIMYVIWSELFVKLNNNVLTQVLTYGSLASFWSKYKAVESNLTLLFVSKICLLNNVLSTFFLTAFVLRSFSLVRFNNVVYRVSVQTLNRLKLRNKSLSL